MKKLHWHLFPAFANPYREDPPADPPTDPPADPPSGDKTFTGEQVEQIVKRRLERDRKGRAEEEKKTLDRLKQLEQSNNLTKEERDELRKDIADIETKYETDSERWARERKTLTDQHRQDLDRANKDVGTWKSRFIESSINRALTDAAASKDVKAIDSSQIVMMFRGSTELVEQKDDEGKGTGQFVPTLTFQGVNKEGDIETMVMPVLDALKKIRKDDTMPNLFANSGTPGTGKPAGKGKNPSGKWDGTEMPRPEQFANPEAFNDAYQKWRDENELYAS